MVVWPNAIRVQPLELRFGYWNQVEGIKHERMSQLRRLRSLKQDTRVNTEQEPDAEQSAERTLSAVFPPGQVALFFLLKLEIAMRTGSLV